MVTLPPSKTPLPPDPSITIIRVEEPRQRLAAARRLLGHVQGDADAAKRLLEAADRHSIDLTHLWASVDSDHNGSPRQVCLCVVGSGRSAMLFTSAPQGDNEQTELAAVIQQTCAHISGVDLAQALLDAEERGAKAALAAAGFISVGTLAYMRRNMPKKGETEQREADGWPTGITVRNYRVGDDPAIIRAMDLSYEQTLDCPELCGLRQTRHVFESHRLTGQWDPTLWWVLERDGQLEGLMLFSPCPDQNSVELVYLGLSLALRRQGIGRRLLQMGLRALAGRRERFITCAVDDRNTPALRVYAKLGFEDFARRVALVKPVRSLSQ